MRWQLLRTVSGFVLLVMVLIFGAVGVGQAQAAPTPFTCTNDFYFMYQTGQPAVTHIARVDRSGAVVTVTDIGTPIAAPLNAMGYNTADGFLYAVEGTSGAAPGTIHRIASDGTSTTIGVPVGLNLAVSGFTAGTFIAPNKFLVGALRGISKFKTTLVLIDIPTNTVEYSVVLDVQFNDFATNPLDGKVYGLDTLSGQLVYFDPSPAATMTLFGASLGSDEVTTGSTWFLDSGQMFLYGTAVAAQDQDRFYDADAGVNGNGTGVFTELGKGPVVKGTDGASCVSLKSGETTTTTTTAPTTTTTVRAATTTTTPPATTTTTVRASTTTTTTPVAAAAQPVVAAVSFTG